MTLIPVPDLTLTSLCDRAVAWPRRRFDEILSRIDRKVTVDDEVLYSTVGVRWYGNGAFIRRQLLGVDIARKQQWIIRSGDIVYNKLFAWKGAFAVADDSVDGRLVSDKFPTYEGDLERVDLKYLEYFFRTPGLAHQALLLSKGAAAISKLTLNPPHFSDLTIPLPPLDDQRRVADLLGEIERRVRAAQNHRERSRHATSAVCAAVLNEAIAEKSSGAPLRELVAMREPDVEVSPDENYQFAGVYSFGRGVFRSQQRSGTEFSYNRLTRLREDDFVYPKLMAWEGAFGVVPRSCAGCVVSPEFPVFEVDQDRVLAGTLEVYFSQPQVWATIAGASRGTNVRRRRLHPKVFLEHVLPLPTMAAQRRLQVVIARMKQLTEAQERMSGAIDAVMLAALHLVFDSSD